MGIHRTDEPNPRTTRRIIATAVMLALLILTAVIAGMLAPDPHPSSIEKPTERSMDMSLSHLEPWLTGTVPPRTDEPPITDAHEASSAINRATSSSACRCEPRPTITAPVARPERRPAAVRTSPPVVTPAASPTTTQTPSAPSAPSSSDVVTDAPDDVIETPVIPADPIPTPTDPAIGENDGVGDETDDD